MTKTNSSILTDADLEALFDAARETPILPSDALWARVHADAVALIPEPPVLGAAHARQPVQKAGFLASLLAAIGGWTSLAGLTAATLTGVWVGFANPVALDGLSETGLLPGVAASATYALEDLIPGFSGFETDLEDG